MLRRENDECAVQRCRYFGPGWYLLRDIQRWPQKRPRGRIYEKRAIEQWFSSRQGQQLKSPVTNEPMGKKLLPAVQVRNMIKSMVQSGAIAGDKADAWKRRMAKDAEVALGRTQNSSASYAEAPA